MLDALILIVLTSTIQILQGNEESTQTILPFFVMQPNTIINQTLHSYCKEQIEFNDRPMFINLTEWPSGFIYARNPHQNIGKVLLFNRFENEADSKDQIRYHSLEDDYDTKFSLFQECTLELRAPPSDRIRLVFHPIRQQRDDYETDYDLSHVNAACLKIRDTDETITFDCPFLSDRSSSLNRFRYQSEDHLSNSNVLYLELILPKSTENLYDPWSNHQFKLFFTTFTPKLDLGRGNELLICPKDEMIDCDDRFCVHRNARCNGINDCRSKVDEDSCPPKLSNGCFTDFPLSTSGKLTFFLYGFYFIQMVIY